MSPLRRVAQLALQPTDTSSSSSELQPLKGFGPSPSAPDLPYLLIRCTLIAAVPKRELEQYVTTPHLAARMLYTAESSFGDIDEKDVLDLGCGCAILSIASVMMGAK